jgi:hypothetical protein
MGRSPREGEEEENLVALVSKNRIYKPDVSGFSAARVVLLPKRAKADPSGQASSALRLDDIGKAFSDL